MSLFPVSTKGWRDEHRHDHHCIRESRGHQYVDCPYAKPLVQQMIRDVHEALDRQLLGMQNISQSLDSYIGTPVTMDGRTGHISAATMDQDGIVTFTVTMGDSGEIAGRGPEDCGGCSSHKSHCCCDDLSDEPDE